MKRAISNIAWVSDAVHDDAYYYQLIKQYGFEGLEIAPTKFNHQICNHTKATTNNVAAHNMHHAQKKSHAHSFSGAQEIANPPNSDTYSQANISRASDFKNALITTHQLPIVSMQSLLFGTTDLMLFTNSDNRKQLKQYLKRAILYAQAINCPVLVFGNPKNRIMQHARTDYEQAILFFSELADFANDHHTCLCIEPNPLEYGTNFINTITSAQQLVNDVATQGFAMIIDASTMIINNDPPTITNAVLENTKHIHLSMPFLKPLNHMYEDHKNWVEQFVQNIMTLNYDKYLSIEMTGASANDVELSLDILNKLVNKTT